MRFGVPHVGLVLLVVLGVTACTSEPDPDVVGTWTVAEVPHGADAGLLDAHVRFADGQFVADMGCNKFSGGYLQQGSSVSLQLEVETEIGGCPAAEESLRDLVDGAEGEITSTDKLTLPSDLGDVKLTRDR